MRATLLPPDTNGLDTPTRAHVPCCKALIFSTATLCLVLADGVGAVGVSAVGVPGESVWAGGFQHGLLLSDKPGFSCQCGSAAPGKQQSTGVDEASSAPKRVPLTMAWGALCPSHNCFKILRFSSDLT